MKKPVRKSPEKKPVRVSDAQAEALREGIHALLRQFKLVPGLLADSPYAGLHVNDLGLLSVLAEVGDLTVRGIALVLGAPDSTVSSALDRLEGRGLVTRRRQTADRRVVRIGLTKAGLKLTHRLYDAQVENSRAMLARLDAKDRVAMIRLVAKVAQLT